MWIQRIMQKSQKAPPTVSVSSPHNDQLQRSVMQSIHVTEIDENIS